MTKVHVEFDTREYEFSHGKSPRGRGTWAFFPTRQCDVMDAMWSPSMTYAEAKRWAKDQAQTRWSGRDHVTLFVGS